MIFALACAALLLATMAVLLRPLLRPRAGNDDAGFDRAVYRAQLAELDEDRARDLIGPEEADAARAEIARRLLAADRPPPPPRAGAANPALAALLAALVAASGGGLYLLRGAPDLDPRTPPEALAQEEAAVQARQLLEQTAREPGNVAAWLNLGRANSALGRWPEAIAAYRRALVLRPGARPVLGALGEALTMEAGRVTQEARAAFAAAPQELASRFYLAQAALEAGDAAAAIAAWQKLAADLPPDAPIRAELARRAAAAARQANLPAPVLPAGTGPDAETMEAAASLPAQDREAMARAMVARLAERLAATPGDAEGWLRLGRAWLVLGEQDKSAEAFDRAAALMPGEAARLQQIAALFETTPMGAPLPARLRPLIEAAAARAPNEPELIWYQGMLAARSGQREAALEHWRKLLPLLPETSEERRLVQTAIDALARP